MKYLKLQINTPDGTLLYEKDVEPANAFESFIRKLVAQHVATGLIYAGEHYTALVIPRYEESLIRNPLVMKAPPDAAQNTWITLRLDPNATLTGPARFFTIELHIRERDILIRQDFQVSEIGSDFVAYGIEQALIGLGVLKPGMLYRTLFFARDDNEADFDREHIPSLEQRAASLIEFLSDEPEAPSFPYRDVALYGNAQLIGAEPPGPDDVRIYMHQAALDRIRAEAKVSEEVERGGMLVGGIYRSADSGRYVIEISDFIVSEGTVSSETELTYTFQSWQSQQTALRERFPGRRVVGWYHTHVIEMEIHAETERADEVVVGGTTMFFSQHDVFLHSQFFADEWYVALVLDPWGKSMFFQWKGGRIVPCPAFYTYTDLGVA